MDSKHRESLFLSAAQVEALYEHERSFWGYYVKGAPCNMTFNIATSRGLVNGCPGTQDSLSLAEGTGTLAELLAALRFDEPFAPGESSRTCAHGRLACAEDGVYELELFEMPLSINVSPRLPRDEAASMIAAGLSLDATRSVVPVPLHSRPRLQKTHSVHAALYGLPEAIRLVDHQLDLAFAVTDFKLQSKTVTKLILSLGPRSTAPFFSLSTVYVLASRVKLGLQLRVIGLDPRRDSIKHLTSLLHPADLGIWEASYVEGRWDDARRDAAITAALGGSPLPPL